MKCSLAQLATEKDVLTVVYKMMRILNLWVPLNSEQIAELFKEATAVSIFLKSSSLDQSLGNEDVMTDERENKEICKILSKTFSVDDDQENMIMKPDQDDGARIEKSLSSPESEDSISPQPREIPDDMVIPSTPRRILQEKNSQDAVFQSPFKGRKARPLQNVSKFIRSKLPKTQMTLKTRSCFNSVSIPEVNNRQIINNYSLKWRWIFTSPKRLGKYPPLSPTLRWIIVLVYTTQAE